MCTRANVYVSNAYVSFVIRDRNCELWPFDKFDSRCSEHECASRAIAEYTHKLFSHTVRQRNSNSP